jgi:hypothetical protein
MGIVKCEWLSWEPNSLSVWHSKDALPLWHNWSQSSHGVCSLIKTESSHFSLLQLFRVFFSFFSAISQFSPYFFMFNEWLNEGLEHWERSAWNPTIRNIGREGCVIEVFVCWVIQASIGPFWQTRLQAYDSNRTWETIQNLHLHFQKVQLESSWTLQFTEYNYTQDKLRSENLIVKSAEIWNQRLFDQRGVLFQSVELVALFLSHIRLLFPRSASSQRAPISLISAVVFTVRSTSLRFDYAVCLDKRRRIFNQR